MNMNKRTHSLKQRVFRCLLLMLSLGLLMSGPTNAAPGQLALSRDRLADAPTAPSADAAAVETSWPMAGANPQRTSWTAEQVPSAEYMSTHRNQGGNGMLYPQWYRPIEPYIPEKVQVIAANGLLYVSTARGLYHVQC